MKTSNLKKKPTNLNDVPADTKREGYNDHDDKKLSLLVDIQRKVSSPALNGGFDKLMYKVSSIEENQRKMDEKVNLIHDAINHPEHGIFSKISGIKTSMLESQHEFDKKLNEIDGWKKQQDKISEKEDSEFNESMKSITQMQTQVNDLIESKKFVYTVLKWTGAAFGGGVVTLLFKVVYDWMQLHIK